LASSNHSAVIDAGRSPAPSSGRRSR
jgi:hypothetical protein